jgi:hypothetical protein
VGDDGADLVGGQLGQAVGRSEVHQCQGKVGVAGTQARRRVG